MCYTLTIFLDLYRSICCIPKYTTNHPPALSRTAPTTIIICIIKLEYLFTARSMHIHPHVNTTCIHTHTQTFWRTYMAECTRACFFCVRAKRPLCASRREAHAVHYDYDMADRLHTSHAAHPCVWWHMPMPRVHACVASCIQLVHWHVCTTYAEWSIKITATRSVYVALFMQAILMCHWGDRGFRLHV